LNYLSKFLSFLWTSLLNFFEGMLTTAITAGIFYGVGSFLEGAFELGGFASQWSGAAKSAFAVGMHFAGGVVSGGINAAITGGDILKGAAVGGFSAGVAKGLGGSPLARIAVGALAGGIASDWAGGSFSDGAFQGAWTSALAIVFNDLMTEEDVKVSKLKTWGGRVMNAIKVWSGYRWAKSVYYANKFTDECLAELQDLYDAHSDSLIGEMDAERKFMERYGGEGKMSLSFAIHDCVSSKMVVKFGEEHRAYILKITKDAVELTSP
jgi:hypothetical protein